jgi:hypothetical protein
MTPAQILARLRRRVRCDAHDHGCVNPCWMCNGVGFVVDESLIEAANLIESLTAENDCYERADEEHMTALRQALGCRDMHHVGEGIAKLTAERDGLAGIVVVKDEALRDVLSNIDALEKQGSFGVNEEWAMDIKRMAHDAGDTALALTLPEAVAQAQRQLAAAKLDGERLDWIEKQEPSTINETKSCGGQWAWVVYQDKEESLREAVDAARQKEGK